MYKQNEPRQYILFVGARKYQIGLTTRIVDFIFKIHIEFFFG